MDIQKLFRALRERPFGRPLRIAVAHSRPSEIAAAITLEELAVGEQRVMFQAIAGAVKAINLLDQELLEYAVDKARHQRAVSRLVLVEHESERVKYLLPTCIWQVLQRK